MKAPPVRVAVEVQADPLTAFTIFTEEISSWWRRDTPYWNDRERGQAVRFELRLGGRLLEVWDLSTGEGLERVAFKGFDPKKVARFAHKDVDRLAGDTRIIRNRSKIEATIANARTMVALDKEFRGFKQFLRSQGGFEETVASLTKRFKFIGELGAYYFLCVVSEPVPPYRRWARSRGVTPRAPRRRAT